MRRLLRHVSHVGRLAVARTGHRSLRRRPGRNALVWLGSLLAAALMLSGCGFSVYSLPLPGGADTGSNPLTVHIQFRDVLDLVPDSTVKVNDVSVGEISSVDLEHGIAVVTAKINRDTKLPANVTAKIEQTSLLGEKFVDLVTPSDPSPQRLQDNATIPLARTGDNPEIEQVLSALSLVLNGGGVAQLKTISTELNKALGGREDAARSVITQVDSLVGSLSRHRSTIVEAIDKLNTLSTKVKAQEGTIDETLDELPAALKSINGQRRDLVKMLQALDRLGKTGTRVIFESKANTIAVIRDLQPTLTNLAATGDHFVSAFNTLLTYPFVDAAVGTTPQVARNIHFGDYVNLDISLDLDYSSLLGSNGKPPTLLPPTVAPTKVINEVLQCLTSGSLTSQACKDVLGSVTALTQLVEQCKKKANQKDTVCQLLNTVPGLPNLSNLPGGLSSVVPSGVASLLGGLGLRSNTNADRPPLKTHDGLTRISLRQLGALYDPDLVALMVPPLKTKEVASR